MKIFRTLSTRGLIVLAAAATAVLVTGVVAVAARGGSGSTPPPKPLAQAMHDALGAAAPDGVTARISFTNKLFPSGALTGPGGLCADDGRDRPAVGERDRRPAGAPVRRRRRADRLDRHAR